MPKKIAALLGRRSRRPTRSATARATRCVSCSLDTSTRSNVAPMSRATAEPFSALTSAATTVAPSRTKRRAYASPIPCAAPVTITTLPASFMHRSLALAVARWQGTASSRPEPPEPLNGARHDGFVPLRLDRRAEELDVVPAAVPGVRERPAEAAERDVAVADHHALARAERPDLEVAHLHDRDPRRAPQDVVVEPPLDPGVIQLQHDPERRPRQLV